MDPDIDALPKRVTQWAPIAGIWTFENSTATYNGPVNEEATAFGIALSAVQMRDGVIQAHINFEAIKEHDTAGIILGFQSITSGYAIVSLGAYSFAYSIQEFEPASGWRILARAGSITNLKPNYLYSIKITQVGQKIGMVVDKVRIFEYILPRPLPGNQVGLFAFGRSPVRFENIEAQRERPRAFVAMQFMEPFDTLYHRVIKPEAEALGFIVMRIDEISGPGIIFEDIKREIAEAKVLIAEITAPNQNVFYELGYAHALNKPTILLAQRGKELPFDIRSYRVIFYEDTIGGKPIVEENLRKHLSAILSVL